jgi:hypothetical protein
MPRSKPSSLLTSTIQGYPIYHYQNETHYDNSTLYLEWLRCTFLAHFIDSTDQSIIDAGLVACLLDDDFKVHRVPEVEQAFKEKGATHLLISNTKLGQPHDYQRDQADAR